MKKPVVFLSITLLSCLTFSCQDDTENVKVETGTVQDHEGNTYKTVKIGDQWWMSENLSVSTFSNGESIPFVDPYDSAGWAFANGPRCSRYQGNANAPGLLYNAYAIVDSRKIAPSGWHVATEEDWEKLEVFIGLTADESEKSGWRGESQGDAMKKKGLDEWARYGSVWATDAYGFSAKAGGCRLHDARYSYPSGLQFQGFWWTCTSAVSGEHYYRHLDYKQSGVFRSHTLDSYGMSVRCVKD